MHYDRWKGGPHWAVYDEAGEILSICLYKKGAISMIRCILELRGCSEAAIILSLERAEENYKTNRKKAANL